MRRFYASITCMILAVVLCGCSSSNGKQLRVMTYNIHHAEGIDGVLDIERIAGVIADAGADIVALNEVDNNYSARSENKNQPKLLAEALNMHYVYGATLTSGPEDKPHLYGNAVLSKYPIIDSANHKLANAGNEEARCALAAKIKIGDTDYTFIATHLNHRNGELRIAQANSIIEILESIDTPVILAGDFNCRPGTNAAEVITEKMVSTFAAAGIGSEGTTGRGTKIDFIFVSPDLEDKIMSAEVVRNDITKVASDHLPMVSDIKQ